MATIYIVLLVLLVNTSYQQNIIPDHKRRQCNALQSSEVMEKALPEIRRYFQSELQSSRRKREEIKSFLSGTNDSLQVFKTKLETYRGHNNEMKASLGAITAELEINRRYKQKTNVSLGVIQSELETSRKQIVGMNVSFELFQAELETSRQLQMEMNSSLEVSRRQNEEMKASLDVIQSELEQRRRQNEEMKDSLAVVQAESKITREHLRLVIRGCELAWVHHGGYCYLFVRTHLNFEEAKVRCQHHNAYVAEVRSENEQHFIMTELKKIDGYKFPSYYLGGYYNRAENEWIWERTGETIGYTRWAPGEPNDFRRQEDCLFMRSRRDRLWIDAQCRVKSYFICMKSLIPS
ncbi:low affinity immunoglobulin epsilon Fc receptor-like isoform X2 [Pecten maximus]|uniref:low affinity immunoglobulin epsilon Fc receptor-like isoform X2 n=1 Tax=Pecten maximus TaxID=6579 RepID=UPI001457F962|nr:low affinity immunoglobulin epsilon Fc receptor-like isoform X2 [Pecten maximus]